MRWSGGGAAREAARVSVVITPPRACLAGSYVGIWSQPVSIYQYQTKPAALRHFLTDEPCITQIEELLGRLRGILPEAPWLGGVLQPAAWGPGASLRGALFMNSQTFDEGAVGVMLRGPLRFDQLCWQVRRSCLTLLLRLPEAYMYHISLDYQISPEEVATALRRAAWCKPRRLSVFGLLSEAHQKQFLGILTSWL